MPRLRRLLLLAVVLTAGTLMGMGVNGGCFNLLTEGGLFALNPCGILDCTAGLFGGAIDPCGVPGNAADDLFVGCP